MKISHQPRKFRRMFIRKYYGYLPPNWETITDLPEPNMEITLTSQNTNFISSLCITPAPAECAKPHCKEEENSMTTQNTERDYLRRELTNVSYAKEDELAKMFRIHNLDTPQTYKDLIDAIKNGKYTLDEKVTKKVDAYIEEHGRSGWGPFYGIKFNLDNAPDYDGFHKAIAERNRQRTIAERIIMTGDAAAGLKALQDFEAWTPVGKAN